MTGVVTEITLDVGKTGMALRQLSEFDVETLTYAVGALVEDQTKRRISDDRTDPDGKPWKPWSSGYSMTRHGGHSLLVGEGNLHDSIQSYTTGDTARVGSNLVYSAIHQFGGTIYPVKAKRLFINFGYRKIWAKSAKIPARPYLGLSSEDRREIEDLVMGNLEEILS